MTSTERVRRHKAREVANALRIEYWLPQKITLDDFIRIADMELTKRGRSAAIDAGALLKEVGKELATPLAWVQAWQKLSGRLF